MQEEIVNTDQADAWDGPEGEGWARSWERYDRSVAAYEQALLDAARVSDGEQIVDVGCGNGQSTRDLVRSTPSGSALGIDLSGPMLARARELVAAAGLTNVEFLQGDAEVHPFEEGRYDVAVSRFGAMFFAHPADAFANIGRAIAPGGRLVLVAWQAVPQNVQFSTIMRTLSAGRARPAPPPGAPGPFSLADPAIGRALLEAAGFVEITHTPVPASFHAGADADDALAFLESTSVAANLLDGLDEATRAAALADLHEELRIRETPDGVLFDSAAWLIEARRPG